MSRSDWDREGFEYVVSVRWASSGLFVVVQSRDQRRMQVLEVDPSSGTTRLRREDFDPAFLDVVAGTPAVLDDGTLVWTAIADDTRRLLFGEQIMTPPGLQVRSVLDVDGSTVLFSASDEPTEVHLWTASAAGLERQTSEPGVHSGRRAGGTTVVFSRTLERDGTDVTVRRGGAIVGRITSRAETPVPVPRVSIDSYGSAPAAHGRAVAVGPSASNQIAPGAARSLRRTRSPTSAMRAEPTSWSPSGSPTRASPCW